MPGDGEIHQWWGATTSKDETNDNREMPAASSNHNQQGWTTIATHSNDNYFIFFCLSFPDAMVYNLLL
jgi:hypothetical protein